MSRTTFKPRSRELHQKAPVIPTLSLTVQVYGGTSLPDAVRDLVLLATRLRLDVWAEINGVGLLARPDDSALDTLRALEQAIAKKQSHAATR